MTSMRKRSRSLLVAAALAGAVTALPMSAGADASRSVNNSGPSRGAPSGAKPLAIAFHMTLTGSSSAAGTFSMAGAVSDSGDSAATFTLTPTDGDKARLEGTQTLTSSSSASQGTLTLLFSGTSHDVNDPRQFAEGRFQISAATGDYEGLRVNGRFLVVGDGSTGQITGTYDGKVRNG